MTADHCGTCNHWSADVFALDGVCQVWTKTTHRADTCEVYEDCLEPSLGEGSLVITTIDNEVQP